jgi:hypothetical protein
VTSSSAEAETARAMNATAIKPTRHQPLKQPTFLRLVSLKPIHQRR